MPDTDQLLAMWDTYAKRSIWHEVSLRGGDQAVATDVLDKLPEVSALDALAANRDLVKPPDRPPLVGNARRPRSGR